MSLEIRWKRFQGKHKRDSLCLASMCLIAEDKRAAIFSISSTLFCLLWRRDTNGSNESKGTQTDVKTIIIRHKKKADQNDQPFLYI